MGRLCTTEIKPIADKQETADTQIVAKNQEKEGTTGKKGCDGHMGDKQESTEPQALAIAAEQMNQLYTSPLDKIKIDQWLEERDMPPIKQLSVDDHLTVYQGTSESENSYCTASTSENGKTKMNN
jgi:hypothetical protein